MKRIVVYSDGRPGHYNQSLAVAEALKALFPSEIHYREIGTGRAKKYLLRMMLNRGLGRRVLKSLPAKRTLAWFYPEIAPDEVPDIVVSSGKETSLPNALTGLLYGSKTLFVGNPKKLDHRLFTYVLTVLDLGFDNQILLDVAPTLLYKGDIEAFCAEHGLDPALPYATLLIGGDGSGYRYTESEIDALITFVNATASEINWLVTTSRRTDEAFERKMQREMRAAMFVAYHEAPQKVVGPFLALSDIVYVTEESASMVSEAVASGKKVYSLVPNNASLPKDYRQIIQKFEQKNLIQRKYFGYLWKDEINNQQNTTVNNSFKKLVETLKRDMDL